MSKQIDRLVDRAEEAGYYTLNEIRDQFKDQVSSERALELTIRVHNSLKDLTEAERVCALICALMAELI